MSGLIAAAFSRHWLAVVLLVAGAAAHANLMPFANARVQDESRSEQSHYRVILSELKRSQATTFGEREARISGSLQRTVWALPSGIELESVISHYQHQLDGKEVLYQCQGLDCGSSHFWANEIFSNGRLVGREKDQAVMVVTSPRSDQRNDIWVVYMVRRATRQVMVNVDYIITSDALAGNELQRSRIEQVLADSYGWLPGFIVTDERFDEAQSQVLVDTLKALTPGVKQRLHLMVHCYDSTDMASNMRCSERLAQQLRAAVFDGQYDVNVTGLGALTLPPDEQHRPSLRFVFWPERR
ncbi:DUF4892 domain-containing protein [Bacterioplanes sanyensis]|nr:DUF4892 domain-containing protein [Bacterioplanes sanyensis]